MESMSYYNAEDIAGRKCCIDDIMISGWYDAVVWRMGCSTPTNRSANSRLCWESLVGGIGVFFARNTFRRPKVFIQSLCFGQRSLKRLERQISEKRKILMHALPKARPVFGAYHRRRRWGCRGRFADTHVWRLHARTISFYRISSALWENACTGSENRKHSQRCGKFGIVKGKIAEKEKQKHIGGFLNEQYTRPLFMRRSWNCYKGIRRKT